MSEYSNEGDLTIALRDIIWKLNRKTMDQDGKCHWATIDINDIVIQYAKQALLDGWTGQPYEDYLRPTT